MTRQQAKEKLVDTINAGYDSMSNPPKRVLKASDTNESPRRRKFRGNVLNEPKGLLETSHDKEFLPRRKDYYKSFDVMMSEFTPSQRLLLKVGDNITTMFSKASGLMAENRKSVNQFKEMHREEEEKRELEIAKENKTKKDEIQAYAIIISFVLLVCGFFVPSFVDLFIMYPLMLICIVVSWLNQKSINWLFRLNSKN